MKKIHNFTLVELLVTMGVFCILLMVSMQIFGNAGKLWTRSEQKNNTFAAARTALEFVSARIQSHAYTEDMPFEISNDSTQHYRIFFPTVMPMNRKDASGNDRDKYSMRFVGFDLDENSGILKMYIHSDEGNSSFLNLMPPYSANRRRRGGNNYSNADDARTGVRSEVFTNTETHNTVEIVENVTDFRFYCYDLPQNPGDPLILRNNISGTNALNSPPYLLVIELRMLESKDIYRKWSDSNTSAEEKEEIVNEFGHAFHRALLLGDRRRL